MTEISEIDAMKVIDDTLNQITDKEARDRILEWAWKKFCSKSDTTLSSGIIPQTKPPQKQKKVKKVGGKKSGKKSKSSASFSIVKDLNLKPSGKESFKDFTTKKAPSSNQEKCVVAVYYLQKVLELGNINFNHIFTCYKDAKWRAPGDIGNIVRLTSNRKGWLDTSDSTNIRVTVQGENLIEHDLPPKKKEK